MIGIAIETQQLHIYERLLLEEGLMFDAQQLTQDLTYLKVDTHDTKALLILMRVASKQIAESKP